MSSDKSGSPPCGIYVRIDDFSNMLDLIGYVRKMAFTINQSSGYEKNLAIVEVVYDANEAERHADIIPIIQAQGMIAIVSGHIDASLDADGVLLDDVVDYSHAREALGDDAIIGVICDDKAEAERAKDIGVDYVVLNADPALITWWSAQTDILSTARGHDITNTSCGALVSAGADFVDVTNYILTYEQGIMQATVNILYAIDLAAQTPKVLN